MDGFSDIQEDQGSSRNTQEASNTDNLENVTSNQKQCSQSPKIKVQSAIPKKRTEVLKWNGWGYKDSKFQLKNGIVEFIGDRYLGHMELPYLTQWVLDLFRIDLNQKNESKQLPQTFPVPNISQNVLSLLEQTKVSFSTQGEDRLLRAHGQTTNEVYRLRHSSFNRIPDVVVWPECTEDVEKIVKLAHEHNLVIIPFGGGTSVSGAVECPQRETRTIISLDTSQMNSILWLDEENLVACIEAGIIGQDLERELQARGYTSGHEPDSYEFSSLGGWVATRASGMKKNVYGNIEDLLIQVTMVTARGTLEKPCRGPRISSGPDFDHVILGSEGTLGVITKVVLKIRPLPKCRKYGSIVFPDFESGVRCLREVARQRCQPSSIRLMDNAQFKFGQSLRPVPGYFGLVLDGLKKLYITKIKGFDVDSMCVTTLLFEGNPEDVKQHQEKIYAIAAQFGGIPAGETNGLRGYMLTFVIAYIRDLGLDYHILSESFETSVPWDKAMTLCSRVKQRVDMECKSLNIQHYLISSRVTQTYDAGCCVYFYFAYNYIGQDDPIKSCDHVEHCARDEIIACGGSISHHHGIGKLRSHWYPQQVSPLGVDLYKSTKQELDPKNVFASGNLLRSHL
uniref:Alkylglycerone-phosphate synthase n=2 Tax=Cacopsylla melanoneura TaxID=428564 RepID=A0A8D8LM41_9HEMI